MPLPQDIPYIRDTTGTQSGYNYGSTLQYIGTNGGQSEKYSDDIINQCYMLRCGSLSPYTTQGRATVPTGKPKTQLTDIYAPYSNGNPGLMLIRKTSSGDTRMGANGVNCIVSGYRRNLITGAVTEYSNSAPVNGNVIVGDFDLSKYCIVPNIACRGTADGSTHSYSWKEYKESHLTDYPDIVGITYSLYYKSNLTSTSRASDISSSTTIVGSFVRTNEVPLTVITGGANAYVRDVYSVKRQITLGGALYIPLPVPYYDPIQVPGIGTQLESYTSSGGVISTHSPSIQRIRKGSNGRIDYIYIGADTAEAIIHSLGLWVCDSIEDTADMHGIYTTSDHVWMPEIGADGIATGNGWTGGGVTDPTESPIYNAWDSQNEIYPVGGSDAVGAVKIDISVQPQPESDNKELEEDTDELLPEAPLINGLGVFANYYAMSETTILSLSDFLWNADESVIDDVINSLKLFGANPVNAIMSLRLYPFDVGAMSGSMTAEEIILGRVQTGAFGLKLTNAANAILDLGSLYIQSHFEDFRDYAPYSAYNLYIPFIGTVSLNPNDYLNRLITIKMIVDITTGKATAIIYANGIPMQYLDGMIGVEIPITCENMGQTANAIISAVGSTAGALATGNMLNAAMTATAGAADVLFNDVSINKIGNVSAAAALFAPINAYVVISRPNAVMPPNYGHARGYSCDMTSELVNLSGYTVCANVDTTGISGATDAERTQIKNLLEGGVYL